MDGRADLVLHAEIGAVLKEMVPLCHPHDRVAPL